MPAHLWASSRPFVENLLRAVIAATFLEIVLRPVLV